MTRLGSSSRFLLQSSRSKLGRFERLTLNFELFEMDNSNNNSSQSRFLIAAVLSMVVLFGWSYFFTPTKPPEGTANTAANTNTAPTAAQPTPALVAQQTTPDTTSLTPDNIPNRQITIKSPLYEVQLDSKGALATSWILLKNESSKSEYPIYADGSTEAEQKPLQLISEEALKQTPRAIPF